jgi:hypothetical protein
MSPYEVTMPGGSVEHWNEEAGAVWLKRARQQWDKSVWLNPVAEKYWSYTASVKLIDEVMDERMFPLTLDGLDKAMRELGGLQILQAPLDRIVGTRFPGLGHGLVSFGRGARARLRRHALSLRWNGEGREAPGLRPEGLRVWYRFDEDERFAWSRYSRASGRQWFYHLAGLIRPRRAGQGDEPQSRTARVTPSRLPA